MKVSNDELREELGWQKHLNNKHTELLENGEVIRPQIPSSYSMIAKTSQSIGLWKLIRDEETKKWFKDSAENFMTKIDKIDELGDKVEVSQRAHQPYDTQNLLYSAILSEDEDIIREAIEYGDDLDEHYLDEYTDFKHLYLHVKALNEYLKDRNSEARTYLDRLDSLDINPDYSNYYESLSSGLRGLINRNREDFVKGVNSLLKHHDTDNELSSASDFVSIDATVYIKLAEKKEGLEVERNNLDPELRDYVPESV